ncbi:MAG: glycosyltransferase [Anaerolineales bacterium]
MLAILPALIPSTMIAVVKPLLGMHQLGHLTLDVRLESSAPSGDIARADLVVFCRNCEPQRRRVLDAVKSAGKPYIYVLDDDLLGLPPSSETAAYHNDPQVRQQLLEYIAGARLVTVFSNTLAGKVRRINPRVEVVAGSVDSSNLTKPHPRSASELTRIVYATSRQKDALAQLFLGDLIRFLDRRCPKIEAHFWGCRVPELIHHPQVRFFDFIPDYDQFLRKFSRWGYDIGLAPLLNDDFHRSKTNNKYREYGACRIAGIYSDVDVYTDCIKHEVNGLIVRDVPGAWHDAILRLVEDKRLRERIQDEAFRDVKERYSLESAQSTWRRQIESVLCEWDSTPVAEAAKGDSPPGLSVGAGPDHTLAGRGLRAGDLIAGLWSRLTTLTRMPPAHWLCGLSRRWSQWVAFYKIRMATSSSRRVPVGGPRRRP